MRRLVLSLAMVLGVTGITFAQATSTVNVTATVITPVAITGSATLAIGNVVQNTTTTISETDSRAAQLTVTGQASTPITISWNTGVTLTDGSGSNPISFTPTLYGSTTGFGSGSALSSGGSGTTISSSGDYYITVGGSISPASAPTGSYSTANSGGTPLTVTVTY